MTNISSNSAINPGTPPVAEQVESLIKQGWQIVSDGPSGVQLKGPKKMRELGKGLVVFGAMLMIFIWPLGIILILCAVLDYAFLTKPETKFIPR